MMVGASVWGSCKILVRGKHQGSRRRVSWAVVMVVVVQDVFVGKILGSGR